MEETIRKEAALKKALQEKEAERMDIEEKYSTLQDEAAGKTRYAIEIKNIMTLTLVFSSNEFEFYVKRNEDLQQGSQTQNYSRGSFKKENWYASHIFNNIKKYVKHNFNSKTS